MTEIGQTADSIVVSQAYERLRQETETYNQQKLQDQLWFMLRLTMGIVSVGVMLAIAIFCGYVILNFTKFPEAVLTIASSALLVDILGSMLSVWKVVMKPQAREALAPVTGPIQRRRER